MDHDRRRVLKALVAGITFWGGATGVSALSFGRRMIDNVKPGIPVTFPPFPDKFLVLKWRDKFRGRDGTDLRERGWTVHSGTWELRSERAEQLVVPDGIAKAFIVTRDVVGDAAIEVKITTPDEGYFITGIVFRFVDMSHYIELELNNSPAYNGWAGFGIWSLGNEKIFTPIVLQEFKPENGTTYTLRLRIYANTFVAECVEAGLIMAGESSLFAGGTGVGLFEARDRRCTNAPRYSGFEINTPA